MASMIAWILRSTAFNWRSRSTRRTFDRAAAQVGKVTFEGKAQCARYQTACGRMSSAGFSQKPNLATLAQRLEEEQGLVVLDMIPDSLVASAGNAADLVSDSG